MNVLMKLQVSWYLISGGGSHQRICSAQSKILSETLVVGINSTDYFAKISLQLPHACIVLVSGYYPLVNANFSPTISCYLLCSFTGFEVLFLRQHFQTESSGESPEGYYKPPYNVQRKSTYYVTIRFSSPQSLSSNILLPTYIQLY